MNDIEVALDASVSEQLLNKIGANINYLLGIQPSTTILTGSGSFVKNPDKKYIEIWAIAAGGGSGGIAVSSLAVTGNFAAGGGGGGTTYGIFDSSLITASVVYSVGAGGTAGPAASTGSGGTGGSTTFGAYITCLGGTGGTNNGLVVPTSNAGVGGTSSNTLSLFNYKGGPGLFGFFRSDFNGDRFAVGGTGGGTLLGNITSSNFVSSGGDLTIAGVVGNSYGCGASSPAGVRDSGGSATVAGSVGGAGVIIIREY
jgi:hypothetical protein